MTADPSITREEARTIGARRYLGGPCQRGHEGWRYTKGSACIECVRIARGGWLKTRTRSAANMVLTLEAKDNGRTPASVDDALTHVSALRRPIAIQVRHVGKYTEIAAARFV